MVSNVAGHFNATGVFILGALIGSRKEVRTILWISVCLKKKRLHKAAFINNVLKLNSLILQQ